MSIALFVLTLAIAGWFIAQNFGPVDSRTAIERPLYTIACGVLFLLLAPFALVVYFFLVARSEWRD
jgi:hypothetical protein